MSDSVYCRLNGLEIDIIEKDSWNVDGWGRRIDDWSGPGRESADLAERGREPMVYTFNVWSKVRADVERVRFEANNAPEDSEFQPFNSEQICYIASAEGSPVTPLKVLENGVKVIKYKSSIKVVCRDGYFYGADKGIPFSRDVALPQLVTLENEGNYASTLDYLQMSGAWSQAGFSQDIDLVIGADRIRLIDKLMRDDVFRMDRFGNIEHSYSTNFTKQWNNLYTDLLMQIAPGASGSLAQGAFTMGDNGGIFASFFGPHPVLDEDGLFMEFDAENIAGTPRAYICFTSDTSDYNSHPLDYDIVEGHNELWVEGAEGEDFVAPGIYCNPGASCTLTSFSATVKRLGPELPEVDPGESFAFGIQDGSNHLLKVLLARYRDVL